MGKSQGTFAVISPTSPTCDCKCALAHPISAVAHLRHAARAARRRAHQASGSTWARSKSPAES
eukprot:1689331-Prymnesium_polylepis.1